MTTPTIDLTDHIQPFWKPAGWSSFDVIRKTRGETHFKKIGHAGTLDPFATGVLILCFGKATKRVSEMTEMDKEYEAVILLGQSTDTLDPTGKVTGEQPVPEMNEAMITATFPKFIGEIDQIPPMFSALKRDGQRLYKLARKGETVKLYPRRVRIDSIDLLDWSPPNMLSIRVICGKGTYIRSLGRDIATALGTVGHVTALCRTRIGPYGEAQSITMDGYSEWMSTEN